MGEAKRSAVTQCKKSNLVIHSMYKMSLDANRVFTYLVHVISTQEITDKEFDEEIIIPLSDLQKAGFIDTKGKSCTIEHLKAIGNELQRVCFSCQLEGVGFASMMAVPTLVYSEEERAFKAKLNKDAIPIFKDSSHRYSLFDTKELSRIDSAYAFRLYEVIKSEIYKRKNGYIPSYEVSLAELKFLLGVCIVTEKAGNYLLRHKGDYQTAYELAKRDKCNGGVNDDWRHFKRTLDRCVKKINDVTKISLTYSIGKRGRAGKIETLVFSVRSADEDVAVNDVAVRSTEACVEEVVTTLISVTSKSATSLKKPVCAKALPDMSGSDTEENNTLLAEKLQQSMQAFSVEDIMQMLT